MAETNDWRNNLVPFLPATQDHVDELIAKFTEEDLKALRAGGPWALARITTRIFKTLPKNSPLLFIQVHG